MWGVERGLVLRYYIYGVLFALIFCGIFTSAMAQDTDDAQAVIDDISFVERSDNDLLIIELRVGRRIVLLDAMFAYLTRGKIFIPLSETLTAIDFPIQVEPGDGTAEGWFLRESNTFSLDAVRHEVIISGQKKKIPADRIEMHYDDIFVDADLFAEWFPLNVEAKVSNQSVLFFSETPLPIEQKIERQNKQERLQNKQDYAIELPDYPLVNPDYVPIAWPVFDIRLNSTLSSTSTDTSVNTNGSVLWAGDLGYQSSSIFFSGDDNQGLSNVRMQFGRSDPDGKLISGLDLTEYEFGDVFTEQVPLVASGRSGVGITLSSFPLERANDFNRVTLRGDIQIDWEVEVYRNDELIAFQQASDDGRYEFIDLPLIGGLNIIKLKFYGPYGEVREEIKRYLVSNQITEPGQTYYRVGAVANDELVWDVSENSSDAPNKGDINVVAQVEHGIMQNFSVDAAVASITSDDTGERREYISVGTKNTWKGIFATTQFGRAFDDDGLAMQFGLDTSLDEWSLSAEHRQFNDFISDETNTSNPIVQTTRFGVNTSFKPDSEYIPRFLVSGTVQRDKTDNGTVDYDVSQRLSTFVGRTSISHVFNYGRSSLNSIEDTLDGSIFTSMFAEKLSLRGEVGYSVKPIKEFNSISLTSDYRLKKDVRARFGVNRQLGTSANTTYSFGLNRKFEQFVLGITSSYDTNENLSIGMNMSLSAGREPRENDWRLTANQLSQDGLVSARVFLDNDQDKAYSEGDVLLEDIGFKKFGGKDRENFTNEEGIALITGITGNKITPLEPDPSTFLDPYWLSLEEGYNMLLRPGRTALVEFPLIPTGEVDGTIYLIGYDREGNQRVDPVSQTRVQLLDNNNQVVKEEVSAFDGFYLFTSVPLGAYTVRVASDQLQSLDLVMLKGDYSAVLTSDELIVSGVDVNVIRQSDIGKDPDLEVMIPDEAGSNDGILFEAELEVAEIVEDKETVIADNDVPEIAAVPVEEVSEGILAESGLLPQSVQQTVKPVITDNINDAPVASQEDRLLVVDVQPHVGVASSRHTSTLSIAVMPSCEAGCMELLQHGCAFMAYRMQHSTSIGQVGFLLGVDMRSACYPQTWEIFEDMLWEQGAVQSLSPSEKQYNQTDDKPEWLL